MKKLYAAVFLSLVAFVPALLASAQNGNIIELQQFTSTTSPSAAITQRVFGRPLKLTGLTTGLCLTLDANSIVTTTTCGSGGGSFPFTPTLVSGIMHSATSTPLLLYAGSIVSSSTVGNLTVGSLTATSSTATSTFSGDVSIASTFNVGSDNSLLRGQESGIVGQSNFNESRMSFQVGKQHTNVGTGGLGNFQNGINNDITNNSTYIFQSGNSNIADQTTDVVQLGNTNTANAGTSDSIQQGNNNILRTDAYDNNQVGDSHDASGTGTVFVGYHGLTTSAVSQGVGLGANWKLSADNSVVIGTGFNTSNLLDNNQANSIYMGIKSNVPTLVITSANGIGKIGNLGIGTTSPWARLSIQDTAYDYIAPLFKIATSSTAFGDIFSVRSTTTTGSPNPKRTTINPDPGVRIAVGADDPYGYGGTLDQFYLNGRMNTGDWNMLECTGGWGLITGPTSDSSNVCPGWQFQIDSAGQFAGPAGSTPADHYTTIVVPAATTNGGAGLFVGRTGLSFSRLATTTPRFEAVATIFAQGASFNSATSSAYIGFINTLPEATTFETAPTAGCYFTASSTISDWQAVCSTSASAMTIVPTGLSSTTDSFIRFRIDTFNDRARFYLQTSTTTLKLVAEISTNYPASTDNIVPTMMMARSTSGTIAAIMFKYVRVWWLRNLFAF